MIWFCIETKRWSRYISHDIWQKQCHANCDTTKSEFFTWHCFKRWQWMIFLWEGVTLFRKYFDATFSHTFSNRSPWLHISTCCRAELAAFLRKLIKMLRQSRLMMVMKMVTNWKLSGNIGYFGLFSGIILNPTLQHVSAHCNEQLTFVNSIPNILSFGRCHMSSDRGTSYKKRLF